MSHRRFAERQSKTLAVAAAALALHGCGSEQRDLRGGVEGELLVGTTDPEAGDVQSIYYLHVPEGQGTDPELVFTKNPYLAAGTHLRVWGDRVGGKLRVKQHEVVEEEAEFGMLQQQLIGSAKKPIKAAIAIVDLGGGSPSLTKDQANTRMFNTTTTTDGKTMSLKFYYSEQSYGIMDVSGKSFDAIPYTMSTCDYNGLGKAVNAALGETFDKYVYYFGTKASQCQWSGLGGGNQAWLNASIGCVVLMQEYGHAVNLPHSSTMTCGSDSFADDPSTCVHNEYGGKHSPMGSACYGMTGWERWREGWLQGCNGVKVKSTGTYTIYPIELPCTGPQVLQVPMAHTRKAPDGMNVTLSHYYLELRAPYGIDTALKPQILIYASAEQPVGKGLGDLRAWVMDQNSSDKSVNGWGFGPGQTFNDPAGGVSINVVSADNTKAEIQVTITSTTVPNAMGDSTCIDNSVFVPGAATECAPTTARPDDSVAPGGASSTGGTTSTGGKGGAGGTAGSSGKGGAGGTAGSSGKGGAGGAAGSAGKGGVGGAAGNAGGGASGMTGTGGASGGTTGGNSTGGNSTGGTTGGTVSTGGSSGATGVGGSLTGGAPPTTGGAAPGTGGMPPGDPVVGEPPPIDGGCACEVGAGARSRGGTNPWSLAALGLTIGGWVGRRRQRDARRARAPSKR